MDLLTQANLRELLSVNQPDCVTLFMPAHRAIPDNQQDPIRLKNLLTQARNRLSEKGTPKRIIDKILGPAEELLKDSPYWQHQSDGLALFMAEGTFRSFRLPIDLDEQLVITDHFYVVPILKLLQSNGQFYVLAISQGDCRLLRGNRDSIQELDERQLPDSMQSALGWWRERNLNFHSMQARPQSRGGGDTAIYHGHYEDDSTKEDLEKYFQRVDKAVVEALHGETAPLLFAGVDYLFPIYKEVNNYPHLHGEAIEGSQDEAKPQTIHKRAWPIVQKTFEKQEQAVLEDFGGRASHDMATSELASILPAAKNGLVQNLVIAEGAEVHGSFCEESYETQVSESLGEESQNLIDLAVRYTLQSSGEVLVVDKETMPGGAAMAAILRAPLATVARP